MDFTWNFVFKGFSFTPGADYGLNASQPPAGQASAGATYSDTPAQNASCAGPMKVPSSDGSPNMAYAEFPQDGPTKALDFTVQLVLLAGLMAWYGVAPGWGVLLVPGFMLLCMLAALSVGLWLTALNVKYRDVGHVVPFLAQMWLWLTPIAYPISMVPEKWRMLFGLNPMTGVVEGFRWALFGTAEPNWAMMGVSFAVVAGLFVSGLFYFRKVERTFADLI